jgi:hypothetical protein
MTFNTTSIAEKIREDVEHLIALTSGEGDEKLSAYEIEGRLWWSLLALGFQLLRLFFVSQHQQEERCGAVEIDGACYAYVGTRERSYWSIFGKLRLKRRAYWQPGQGCVHPLDAALQLPQRQYSYRLQEWVSEWSSLVAYADVVAHLQSWLGLSIPKKSLQDMLSDHAAYHECYAAQLTAPKLIAGDSILVVQADGKGIPMTPAHSPPPEQRRQAGKTASKVATVTSIYTLSPYVRSPEALIHTLLRDDLGKKDQTQRPTPHHKWMAGTLAGQSTAFEQLEPHIQRYAAEHLSHRVAVCDGDQGLQNRIREHLPGFTLILDIFHVLGYLWRAADALLGNKHPMRYQWMHDALHCLLTDDLDRLLSHLHHQHTYLPPAQSYELRTTIRYLSNQREQMHYHTYLALGYPISSGVIEGACCHLVHDRFEQSGMRWSPEGAQAMLDVRALVLNEHWQDFQAFYRLQEHARLYPYADTGHASALLHGQRAA